MYPPRACWLRAGLLITPQYWVVFSLFTVVESFVQVVYWFPFYFVFKFVFLLWLSLPAFRYVITPVSPCAQPSSTRTMTDQASVVPSSFSDLSWPLPSADTSRPLGRLPLASVPRLTASTRPSKWTPVYCLVANSSARAYSLCASQGQAGFGHDEYGKRHFISVSDGQCAEPRIRGFRREMNRWRIRYGSGDVLFGTII